MGLRFRKSFKIAPGVKVNLNKKSSSVTFGGKGVHYTVNSKGKKTTSVGIPGTGVYYTETSGSSKKSKAGKTTHSSSGKSADKTGKKKGGCLIPALIVIVILFVLSSLTGEDDKLKTIELSSDTSSVYDINQDISISMDIEPTDYKLSEDACMSSGGTVTLNDEALNFSSDTPGSFDVWIEDGDIKSNTLTFTIEDKAAIAAQAQAEAEAQAQAEAQAAAEAQAQAEAQAAAQAQAQQPQEQMVWIPQSGSKYHSNSSCSGMNNPRQVTLSEAQSMGYEPCQKCY